MNVSQPHVSQALASGTVHHPSSIIHPRINISLSSNLIDGLGASVSFFIPAKAIVAQSPGFLDTRVGDNIYSCMERR